MTCKVLTYGLEFFKKTFIEILNEHRSSVCMAGRDRRKECLSEVNNHTVWTKFLPKMSLPNMQMHI